MLSQNIYNYYFFNIVNTPSCSCTFGFGHIFNCSYKVMAINYFYVSKILKENRALFSKPILLFSYKFSKALRAPTINKWLNKLINEEEDTNLQCRNIANNLCRYSTLNEVKLYREIDKHYLSQVIQVNINSHSHVDSVYPWHDVIKMPLCICGLLSNSIRQLSIVEYPIKSVLLKTVKVFKFKKCLRNHHNQEETKNIW